MSSLSKRKPWHAVPRSVRRSLRRWASWPAHARNVLRHALYDWSRFLRWSSASGAIRRQEQLRAWILGDAHKIEKALSLASPRPGFGRPVIRRLFENLHDYVTEHGWDRSTALALDCLRAYDKLSAAHDLEDPETRAGIDDIARRATTFDSEARGGCREVTRESIHEAACLDLRRFFETRYSIRHFELRSVDHAQVEEAVRMAQKTPTVCNRQSLKVYAYHDEADKKRTLACQSGNRSFGDQAGAVLVVTCDLQTFFSVGERNQCWIDGGLFSMSLVYALHSLGLGTCCLNWSVEKEKDLELRKVMGLPDSEVVIMMIAVGHLPEELEVARSERRPLDEVLVCRPTA